MPFQQKGENGPSLDFIIFCPLFPGCTKSAACRTKIYSVLLHTQIGDEYKRSHISSIFPSFRTGKPCYARARGWNKYSQHSLFTPVLLDCLSLYPRFFELDLFPRGVENTAGHSFPLSEPLGVFFEKKFHYDFEQCGNNITPLRFI